MVGDYHEGTLLKGGSIWSVENHCSRKMKREKLMICIFYCLGMSSVVI